MGYANYLNISRYSHNHRFSLSLSTYSKIIDEDVCCNRQGVWACGFDNHDVTVPEF